MSLLGEIIKKVTKRRHHYQATLKYTPDIKNSQIYITRNVFFSVIGRDSKTFARATKKAIVGDFVESIPRHLKKNGKLTLENISYLGFFK